MSKQVYKWNRFWCSRLGSINLADGGFLYDPDGEWGKAYNPDLVTFDAISDIPCLALLGEPGIGKTQALEMERNRIEAEIRERGDRSLSLDLRSYSSEDRLVRSLFDSHEFTQWQNSNHQLHIFLDSLDECLLQICSLAMLLIDEFKKYRKDIDRLYLRIACRTAVWQASWEEGLKDIWGENSVRIYELAPLRRIDVTGAVETTGFSPAEFIKEVEQKEIVSLAIKPVTLKFLLNTYHKHNAQFPLNQKLHELYLEGCRELCVEQKDENRHPSKSVSNLDSEQRLIVAARIATITIFANRFAIWTGDGANIPAEDVPIQKLHKGYEKANGRQFEITKVVIDEVLDTGLFSSRGLNRMGWAHQTYAEFLAAWYLEQHQIPLSQIQELLFSSTDPDGKLVPQLHETAAWLASMRMDVLQEIIKTDPDVLLQSDIPTDTDIRAAIVDNLLIQYEQEKLFDLERRNYRRYRKLNHPKLETQLRPYLCDSNKNIEARDLAIDIAEVCNVSKLQEDLLNLSLDSLQPNSLRSSAVNALIHIGNRDTRLKLKSLLLDNFLEDKDDSLRGFTLKALWSDCLTAEELFNTLTRPKQQNHIGSYHFFVNYELIPKLQSDDLVVALKWLENQNVICFGNPFEKIGDAILLKSWENFEYPGVAENFARVALLYWRQHQKITLGDDFCSDSIKRHSLIEQVVSIISETEENPRFLLGDLHEFMAIAEDIFWMLDKLQVTNNKQVQTVLAQLIEWLFNRQNREHIDVILNAAQTNEILHEIFVSYFEAIQLDSTQAEMLKADYYQMQQSIASRQGSNILLEPPPKERILQLIGKFEAGDRSAWYLINMQMTLNPNSKYYNNEFELDLTKLPGWQEADEATRKRIVKAATIYIQQYNEINHDWIGTNTFDRLALSGYRALRLILKESPDTFINLSPEIWKRWAPTIISTSFNNSYEDYHQELVRLAYLYASQECINVLMLLIDKENDQVSYISIIDCFDRCWDERLKLAILEKVQEPILKAKCTEQLLQKLLKHGLMEARDFAKSLTKFFLSLDENERQKAAIACKLLIENLDPSEWSFIWSMIQQDSSFGREVLELVAVPHSSGIYLDLTEAQLAELYIWLVSQYPYHEDLDRSNETLAHAVINRDAIASLRDSVLSQLREKGTLQACSEIQRLIQKLPEITWLKKTLLVAQVNMRRKTWQSPQPEDILQLVLDREKHLVQNGEQLLSILTESLARLELELQGETSASRDLWDLKSAKLFRPIDENAFSDYVKRFLDRDLKLRGIIANREVELRRSYGGNSGERTDIHVDAILKSPSGEMLAPITVIIEVKGCWHNEIQTAMETQLVDRYLADNIYPYGLYLIGWFDCIQWDDQDPRKKQTPKLTIDGARQQFDNQAEQLSSGDRIVRAYVLNAALR